MLMQQHISKRALPVTGRSRHVIIGLRFVCQCSWRNACGARSRETRLELHDVIQKRTFVPYLPNKGDVDFSLDDDFPVAA
jgi:hypothetical protein